MTEQRPSAEGIQSEASALPEQAVIQGVSRSYCEKIGAICFSGACAPPNGCLLEQIEAARQALHQEYTPPSSIKQFLGDK